MRSRMYRFFLAVFLCFSVLTASEGKSKQATIDLVVVDGLGGHFTGSEVRSFKSRETGRDLAKRFHKQERGEDQTATRIPYGHYDLRLFHSGFPEVETSVDVLEPELYLEISIRTATVHIVAISSSGKDLGTVKVESFRGSGDLAPRFVANVATGVPYGVYDLQIKHGADITHVSVLQPDVWVIASFRSDSTADGYSGPSIQESGVIENIPATEEPIYVRLIGLYYEFSVDDKVNISGTSGTFHLNGSLAGDTWGQYLLITLGRSGVLDIREVEFPSKGPIRVDLAQSGRWLAHPAADSPARPSQVPPN